MIASLGIQTALYETLNGDSTLKAMVTGVFDALPQNTAFPYIVIGADTETPWNSMSKIGREVTVTIHIFSRYPGMKEAKEIASRMCELIEHKSLSASGVTTVSSVLDLCQFIVDPDGNTRHGVVRFRFRAQ